MIDKLTFNIKFQVVKSLVQPGYTLDVGCGSKLYTSALPDAIGVDLNKEFEGTINTPDYFMDARNLDFPDETFTTVTLLDTLEHIPESDMVIKEAWRVLKPNGVLVITDPNDTLLFWARLFALRFRDAFRGNPDHIHKFDKDRLVELTLPLFKLEKVMRRGIFTGYRFRRVVQ